jgi:hypothetical protein
MARHIQKWDHVLAREHLRDSLVVFAGRSELVSIESAQDRTEGKEI